MKKGFPHTLGLCSIGLLFCSLVAVPFTAGSSATGAKVTQITAAQTSEEETDKDAMHERMKQLQKSIDELWKEYGVNKDDEIRARITAMQEEFDSISGQLGGDRPVPDALPDPEPEEKTRRVAPSIAAQSPVGCPTSVATFALSPNLRIPASGTAGTITSTINVTGLNPRLWDVDLSTNITHTASADLDITIMSPAGTVVTLTTDNGGTLDNVFNGTVWDDQADPASQVPYAANPNIASDRSYTNNTVAPTLAPEEALAAFAGEDPNGTWTLTITDDALLNFGNLGSWSLQFSTLGANAITTTTTFPSVDPNLPALITNACVQGPVLSTVNVTGAGAYTGRIRLTTQLTHVLPDDMDITLTSPQGTVVTISTDNGGVTGNAFNGTVFSSNANPGGQVPYPNCLVILPCNQGLTTDRVYLGAGTAASLAPEESLAAFNGENPNGVWTLKIVDDSCDLLSGTLTGWSLEVLTSTCCSLSCPPGITVGTDPGACSAVVNLPAIDNGFCSTVTCLPPSGSSFPRGTTTVACTTAAGPGCNFTVTVNDTEAPVISCNPIYAVGVAPSPGGCATVTYATPAATDNCPGVTVACTPPSGSCFAVGTTTVTCVATDAAGNTASTASCGGTPIIVETFDYRLQDDTVPTRVFLFNSSTGQYRYCCDGVTITGTATRLARKGGEIQLEDTRPNKRVLVKVSTKTFRGTASAGQVSPSTYQCQITDRDTRNNTNVCGGGSGT
jgi:subtilisin-like proprotein convertase family protein